MTRKRAAAVAVAAVLLGLTGSRMISSREQPSAQARLAPPPPVRSKPLPSVTLNVAGPEVAALRKDLDALKSELADQAQTSAQQPQAAGPPPSASPDQTELDGAAAAQAIADQLEDRLNHEPFDRAFAQEVGSELATFLQRPELAGTAAGAVECGTTLCRVELHHDKNESRESFLDALSDMLPPDSQGFAHLENQRDLDLEVYFSRGQELMLAALD